VFIFERKNQKNYVEPSGTQEEQAERLMPPNLLSAARLNTIKSFLVLFFKKEHLSSHG
jgi:hypothetical protein